MNILVTKPSLWYLKVFDMYLIFGLGSFIFFGGAFAIVGDRIASCAAWM